MASFVSNDYSTCEIEYELVAIELALHASNNIEYYSIELRYILTSNSIAETI